MENRKPVWKKQERAPMEPRLSPIQVEVRNNDIDQAIKILKNRVAKDGILAELKVKRYFEKKSDKRRREQREAVKKARKATRKPVRKPVKE